jgi:hypothetical protein
MEEEAVSYSGSLVRCASILEVASPDCQPFIQFGDARQDEENLELLIETD